MLSPARRPLSRLGAGSGRRRRGQAPRPHPLLLRRLRARRSGTGILARSAGATGDVERLFAAGGCLARAPQPPPLRRLPRARRRSGAPGWSGRLVDLPGCARREAGARGARARGRLRGGVLRPTGRLDVASNGSLEKINLGADLRVRRDGGDPRTVHTERSYFPSSDPSLGAVSRYFEGEATSEVGLEAGFRRDFWATVAPDTRLLRRVIRRGDRVFEAAPRPAAQRAAALGEALAASRPPTRRRPLRPPSGSSSRRS